MDCFGRKPASKTDGRQWDRLLTLKILGLIIGCVAKFITGSLFVFNAYENELKSTFNYSQKEVEVMSSMLNIGLGVGFLPGMFYDRFGPQWASAIGLVVSVGAYMLLWSTTRPSLIHFYSKSSWLMSIYFFIAGLGSVFTYMVALNTNIINFDQKHTGKVVGLLNAFFAGSPSVFATLYYHVFKDGDSHDYPSFLLLFAISFGVADLLCIIFLRIYKERDVENFDYKKFDKGKSGIQNSQEHEEKGRDPLPNKQEEKKKLDPTGQNSDYKELDNVNPSVSESSGEYTGKNSLTSSHLPLVKLLTNIDYHILVWLFAFSSSVGLVYVNNITVISKSMCSTKYETVENSSFFINQTTNNGTKNTTTCLSEYDDRLTIIIPITNAIVSLSVGLFSDYFIAKLPRLWILIFACVCFLVSQVLVLLFADEITFLMLSTVLAGIAIGILWSIAPTVLKEMFYVGNLGRNWGIAILVAALLGFGMQELYGALYDSKITVPGSKDCFGMACVRGGISVCLAAASLSIVFGILMQFRKTCSQRCSRPV